jgi:hypothetical protein
MADIPQVLATYDALVGVALGAGLTYGFGALNRRHQEAREDKTRWYQARLDAYADFYRALSDSWLFAVRDQSDQEEREKLVSRLSNALGLIQFVGSPEVAVVALALFKEALKEGEDQASPKLGAFVFAARKDLGDTTKGRVTCFAYGSSYPRTRLALPVVGALSLLDGSPRREPRASPSAP